MKSDNRETTAELQPIHIPNRAWQQIATDMVLDLQESEDKTAVGTSIDHLIETTQLNLVSLATRGQHMLGPAEWCILA